MKNFVVNPIGLKGKEIHERQLALMGINLITENKNDKKSAVELTKIGPDGNAYAIVRENHEYYIKKSNKTNGLVLEDFKYIGGLQNKKEAAYPSYAKAIKQLNLKFKSLAEAYNKGGDINVFEDDNLLSESAFGMGFSNQGNMEGMDEMWAEEDKMEEGKSKKAGRDFVGKEISHLMHDKDYPHDRAVAASLNVAREKGYPIEENSNDDEEFNKLVRAYTQEILSSGHYDPNSAQAWAEKWAKEEMEKRKGGMNKTSFGDDVEMNEYEMAIDEMMARMEGEEKTGSVDILNKTLVDAGYENLGYDENYGRINYQNSADKNKEIAIFPAGDFLDKLTVLYYIPNATLNGKKLINYDFEYDSPEEANADLIKVVNGNLDEELHGGQHKLDVDKDGDIGADDLKALRAGAKLKEIDAIFEGIKSFDDIIGEYDGLKKKL